MGLGLWVRPEIFTAQGYRDVEILLRSLFVAGKTPDLSA